MPPSGPPTEQEIWKIARRTTGLIEYNLTSNVCLFGSAASALWADIGRVPNVRRYHSHFIYLFLFRLNKAAQDIDIVVSEGYGDEFDSECIKKSIVRADDRYYLERSRRREATYNILYCRLAGWTTDETRRVKIDILVPPSDLNLPEISADERDHINYIPVMPIFDLLVMKTQGWWDHSTSNRADFRAKERADVSDIFALLDRAKQENVSYIDEANEDRHPPGFMNHAYGLANEFVNDYGRPGRWRALGFPM